MLMPKKTKYRKSHKGKRGGKASGLLNLSFGSYGLKSMGAHWVTSRQIEAARKVITKYTKKAVEFGLEFFLLNRLLQRAGKCQWERAKERLIIMLLL